MYRNALLASALRCMNRAAPVRTNVTSDCPAPFSAAQTWVCEPPPPPCLDLRNVSVRLGGAGQARHIKSFLYTHHWCREPTVTGFYVPMSSPVLDALSDKYSGFGDRYLALERIPRTGECRILGLALCHPFMSWSVREYGAWAACAADEADQHRLQFFQDCHQEANIFEKYKVNCIYNVEVLVTANEVPAMGIGRMLLEHVVREAAQPLVQVVATNHYAAKICSKLRFSKAWSKPYRGIVDGDGRPVYFPRPPHQEVAIFVKKLAGC